MCFDDRRPHAFDPTTQHSPIPEDWLCESVDVHEVEEDLARECLSDAWLRQWKAILGRMEPGDELWDYCHYEEGPEGKANDCRSGYALVRDGRIIDHIGEPFASSNW
jgi:hypothetical protein